MVFVSEVRYICSNMNLFKYEFVQVPCLGGTVPVLYSVLCIATSTAECCNSTVYALFALVHTVRHPHRAPHYV